MGASGGEQLDAIAPLTDHDDPKTCLMLEHGDIAGDAFDSGDECVSLGFDNDDEDLDCSFTPSTAAKLLPGGESGSRSPNPLASSDQHGGGNPVLEQSSFQLELRPGRLGAGLGRRGRERFLPPPSS